MICFRDMTFCEGGPCDGCDTSCRRHLTDEVRAAARRWWGSDAAPIAIRPAIRRLSQKGGE